MVVVIIKISHILSMIATNDSLFQSIFDKLRQTEIDKCLTSLYLLPQGKTISLPP